MKRFILIILLVFLTDFLAFTKLIYSDEVKIKIENGVTVIYNPKNPAPPLGTPTKLKLEEELTIGEKEGRKEYMFTNIIFDVDCNGNIYVLDTRELHIKIFNKNGKFIRMIGRSGQGPGEFSSARFIQITPQKEIMVHDLYARRLIFFSLNGKYLRQIPLRKIFIILLPKVNQKGNIIGNAIIRREKGLELSLINFDPQKAKNIYIDKIRLPSSKYQGIYTPTLQWEVTKKNNLIYGISNNYELKIKNSEGKLIKRIIKEYKHIEILEEDKKFIIKEIFGNERIPPGEKIEFPKYFPVFWNISVDEEGRIFLST